MHPHTSGDPQLIRVGLPLLADDPRSCPRGLALRARPLIKQDPDRPRRRPLEDFALGPVMRELDAIEHGTRDGGPRCHPLHLAWSRHAAQNYLRALDRRRAADRKAGFPETLPERAEWVAISASALPDTRGARRYERTAWGRRYASPDGSVREIWLLSVNSVKENRPEAQIIGAAAVAALGIRATSEYGRPYVPVPGGGTRPTRVRVVAVGCGDGNGLVLADCTVDEALTRYDEVARPLLARMISRRETRPGSDCVRCEGLLGCTEPPRVPDFLGVKPPDRPRKRRSVSASDLRVHDECPAKFHATRVLHLKDIGPEPEAIRRGRAVDAWLNARHAAHPRRGCRDIPLPDTLEGLTPDESEPAVRMLAKHRAVCPLDGLPGHERVRTQPRLTAYDPTIDTVIIADPDLLYTDNGGWVWRETKTASSRPWEGRPLLETYPQLALAVLLMAAGIPDGDRRRSRIELEIIYEDRSACEEIDPFDRPTLEQARAIVSRLAGPWASDETYVPRPGRACRTCEVRRWCGPGLATDGC